MDDEELFGQGANDGTPLVDLGPAHPSPTPNIAPSVCTPPTPRGTGGPIIIWNPQCLTLCMPGGGRDLHNIRLLEGTSHHQPEERDRKQGRWLLVLSRSLK
ncbi:hypothetical protein DPEC_G00178690 [Dallia pectoralis]|uniref:Uncharacterized protein n=1 Tax=Dallia pectoralis TaxID=75939 RepID=A0ACC2GF09_DALPE|nr:hypothetical protein DPEC_G00178690 [Dallia pectoralis]